jgi:hypothetical protein
LTLNWAVAHRMAMMAASHAHDDARVARDDYVDVFVALKATDICCMGKPLSGLAGAYYSPEANGPGVLVNSALDEITLRHTAAHELGHHVFGHGSKMDEPVDMNAGALGGRLPDEERLAEAFAAWFLMPIPAIHTAMQRAGVGHPGCPEDVHQIACWLGTSYTGTVRHLVNIQEADQQEADRWTRAWRNGSARIRAGMCGSQGPPPGRVWIIRPEADGATLHVLPQDTLICANAEIMHPLPSFLRQVAEAQLSFEPKAAVTVTEQMHEACRLTITTTDSTITINLIPAPKRNGIDTAWTA